MLSSEQEAKIVAFVKALANDVGSIRRARRFNAAEDRSDFATGNCDDDWDLGEAVGAGSIGDNARALLAALGMADGLAEVKS